VNCAVQIVVVKSKKKSQLRIEEGKRGRRMKAWKEYQFSCSLYILENGVILSLRRRRSGLKSGVACSFRGTVIIARCFPALSGNPEAGKLG
jgi:hypothetical protein